MKLVVERYGDAAFATLASELERAKEGDPLRRVTVVVPRRHVGLAIRRRLAAHPPGIANVSFLTIGQLAGELAGGWLASCGRRPVTPAVLGEAVRAVLSGPEAGALSAVAGQPATARALAQTYRDVRGSPASSLDALSTRGGWSAEMARLLRALDRELASYYDDVDLVAAATAAATAAGVSVGPVLVYLPARLRPFEVALLEALDHVTPVIVVAGATGDPDADTPGQALVERLSEKPADDAAFAGPVERAEWILRAPTADSEVLAAVRYLMSKNRDGTPLERMALVHSGTAPYPRLLHDVLVRAGIPFNASGIRPLAATVAGRTLLGALELPDGGWRRDDVVAWISSAPVLDGGRPVPASSWHALSCDAGVVSGLDEWQERLADHAAVLRDLADQEDERRSLFERRASECDAMATFVADLSTRLVPPSGSWTEWSRWASKLLGDLLGGPVQTADWPAGEVAALDEVKEVLEGLASLGDRRPGAAAFRAALSAELEAAAPQTSRFGHGIMVGEIGQLAGLELDTVWVLGMVDGAFPGRPADDALVPDAVREACGFPLRGARVSESRRDYFAALAAGRERVLSFATGDQRQGRKLRPARLLLDSMTDPDSPPVFARDLEQQEATERFCTMPSFAAAVAGDLGDPVSPDDWDLRSLLRWTEAGRDPARHFAVDAALQDGFELQRGRRNSTFTRFDGRIDGAVPTSPADPGGRVQSATALESYAVCPRRYFFSKLLGIEARVPPEDVERIEPLERGLLVHRVLERFISEELARPETQRIAPGEPWGEPGRERLARIVAEEFSDFERRGLTGRPALWATDRAAIWGELRHFLREDDDYRAQQRAVPVAAELSFGHNGGEWVTVDLRDGRQVKFRGSIDRVDRTETGGLSVLDYKTGKHVKEEEDPVQRGTRLQLALYGRVARQIEQSHGPIDVHYWFVGDRHSRRGRYRREGFTLDPEREDRFEGVVQSLVDGIEGGRFPGNPAHCKGCDFEGVCPPDRERSWERKKADPWIAEYVALAEPS